MSLSFFLGLFSFCGLFSGSVELPSLEVPFRVVYREYGGLQMPAFSPNGKTCEQVDEHVLGPSEITVTAHCGESSNGREGDVLYNFTSPISRSVISKALVSLDTLILSNITLSPGDPSHYADDPLIFMSVEVAGKSVSFTTRRRSSFITPEIENALSTIESIFNDVKNGARQ